MPVLVQLCRAASPELAIYVSDDLLGIIISIICYNRIYKENLKRPSPTRVGTGRKRLSGAELVRLKVKEI